MDLWPPGFDRSGEPVEFGQVGGGAAGVAAAAVAQQPPGMALAYEFGCSDRYAFSRTYLGTQSRTPTNGCPGAVRRVMDVGPRWLFSLYLTYVITGDGAGASCSSGVRAADQGTLSTSVRLDRSVRVADQGNLARAVVAISSVVVAACAVVVTVKVLSADEVVTIRPERVLDQAAVQQAVATNIQGIRDEPVKVLSCPGSVVVKAGTRFTCTCMVGNHVADAEVEVVNDQGKLHVKW
ncbi:DUF4333 domain-containing protein [Micromonospora sp. NPDC047738]|uniref:DUF4333 domain-containing protein n=1 Tax=Micromonospora sp. NPDC047738 TaxID=3155741 RepID=UPI0033D6ABF6